MFEQIIEASPTQQITLLSTQSSSSTSQSQSAYECDPVIEEVQQKMVKQEFDQVFHKMNITFSNTIERIERFVVVVVVV